MIYKIIDERIIEVEDKKVQLKMKCIILSEKITIAIISKTLEQPCTNCNNEDL